MFYPVSSGINRKKTEKTFVPEKNSFFRKKPNPAYRPTCNSVKFLLHSTHLTVLCGAELACIFKWVNVAADQIL